MDQQRDLPGNLKFIVKDNVLAFTSSEGFDTVSSAIFNGGAKHVKYVLNIGVPLGYSDIALHMDPMDLITMSAAKLEVRKDYLAMVTAANVHNFSLVTKKNDESTVYAAATAGCSHGESGGETLKLEEITGTINIIVLIDGAPVQSCLAAAMITATEAKSAALHDFDVRSRYTGDLATGSITDSVTVATTGKGIPIVLGGPASKLGQLVGACARQAVTEALLKQEPVWGQRSVFDRLKERHLPVEKLAIEISKIKGLEISVEKLTELLKKNPSALASLLAAARMDDDYKKNLLPTDFKDWNQITGCEDCKTLQGYEAAQLPPFIKNVLINIVKTTL
ncbi:MAG TPA: adenosylcobinamide amidohydrolase [Candidatus Acidoferrales bacterium]|nr:adenosylcobinamide amidohydrolase [Candidatus Acidoferrales bacterium]